jgi:hypothetical protein
MGSFSNLHQNAANSADSRFPSFLADNLVSYRCLLKACPVVSVDLVEIRTAAKFARLPAQEPGMSEACVYVSQYCQHSSL